MGFGFSHCRLSTSKSKGRGRVVCAQVVETAEQSTSCLDLSIDALNLEAMDFAHCTLSLIWYPETSIA